MKMSSYTEGPAGCSYHVALSPDSLWDRKVQGLIITRGHILHREGMSILSLTSDSNHQPLISSTFLPVLLTAYYPILTRQDVAWQGHIDLSLVKQPPL